MGVITFDKVKSSQFGIEVSYPPRYIMPEEDYTETHILGLNGDRLTRWGSYKNVVGKYICTFLAGDDIKRIFGDVNRDGRVTASDAAMILRILRGLEPDFEAGMNVFDILASDVDQDGKLTERDASMILQSVVGLLDLPNYAFADSVYNVIANQISQWLHPYYTPKEKIVLANKEKISGKFETSKDGYFRLEDTYAPAFYRKAYVKNSIEVENIYDQGGAFELPFICAPGKYYKAGEAWLDATRNESPSYTIDGYDLPGLHYWHDSELDEQGYQSYYLLTNVSKYVSRPLIRIFFDSNSFNPNSLPTVGQVEFYAPRNAVDETEFQRLRFNMQNFDYNVVSALYLDFDTCQAYLVKGLSKSDLDTAQNDDSALTYYARSSVIESCNDRVTNLYPFTRETGVLYSGTNKVALRFWGGGELYRYRNFEILPRWWTL